MNALFLKMSVFLSHPPPRYRRYQCEDFDDFEIIVTGTMADVIEGEDVLPFGDKSFSTKYGEQLQDQSFMERAKPTSKGLVKYFSSSHFMGNWTQNCPEKIVDSYGDNTIDRNSGAS